MLTEEVDLVVFHMLIECLGKNIDLLQNVYQWYPDPGFVRRLFWLG